MEGLQANSRKTGFTNLWEHEYQTLFNIGCLLGALCFLTVYGSRILDFTYDAWLLNGDMDLRQHYIGWCHYRMDMWQFPFGLIDSLSYPTSMSVIYTDSIPLFAVICKLFSGVLPQKFQYFGLFGLLCFTLQGGISTVLIRKFTDKKWLCVSGSLFFVFSFPMLQRMFYHTALSAQWLILLALLLWFYKDRLDTTAKRCFVWAGMGFLCVFIHSYFLPMTGLILLASLAEQWVIGRKALEAKNVLLKRTGLQLLAYCLTALVSLFLLGGFYGETSAVGEGLGTFGSNLNTFINSVGEGRIFKGLPLYYDFQYEGAGYLGAGLILLLCVVTALLMKHGISTYIREKEKNTANKQRKVFAVLWAYLKEHYRICIALVLFFVVCVFSIFPMVTFGDCKLFGVPYPPFIRSILSIFRSNGRFIWVAVYLLMLGAIVLADGYLKRPLLPIFVFLALLLQIFDLSGMIEEKRAYFTTAQTYESAWERADIHEQIKNCREFVFLYNENDIIMDTAYYAGLHGMRLNNYYYARNIDALVEGNIAIWREELKAGIVKKGIVYIFKADEFEEDAYEGLEFYELDEGHVIGVAG